MSALKKPHLGRPEAAMEPCAAGVDQSPVPMLQAVVHSAGHAEHYQLRIALADGSSSADAAPVGARVGGVLLPTLVPGDLVLAAWPAQMAEPVIVALLVPAVSAPIADRAIALRSEQSITLACGAATLRLTGDGLARLVAHTIEQDARDLVDIDAADVRIN